MCRLSQSAMAKNGGYLLSSKNTCTSCGEGLVDRGFSIFLCPACGEEEIGRCDSCREHSTKYTCSKCSFTGP
ncbi:MAG: zinc finger domain-containing protein [Thermoplasmataceae archaeon]